MDVNSLDISDLRVCMRLGMDFITAHRVAQDRAYDVGKVTASRDLLEQRVLQALEETDVAQMPEDWSWRHAAHQIAVEVSLAIVEEENKSSLL